MYKRERLVETNQTSHLQTLNLRHVGADTVNPLPGKVAENETLFDQCAGSLQANTGAYGYRVMPPCLYGGFSTTSILEVR